MSNEKTSHKLPSLDGWRAASIALVLLGHCAYTRGFPPQWRVALEEFGVGGLGVLFFFVISGFLITWLLLQEHRQHQRIHLRDFYVRRAVRILPVYFVYLSVLATLTHYEQSPAAWLANLTFTTNFWLPPFPTAHLWSLAVEEQFYLLWPCLLAWCLGRRTSCRRLVGLLGVPLLVAPVMRMLECKNWYPEALHPLFQWGSFFVRFDALAFGCLAAVFFVYEREAVAAFFQKFSRLVGLAGVTLIVAPAALKCLHCPARLQAATRDSLHALGFCLLLVQSVLRPTWGFYRILNWRWVSHLGVLSYSLYIWQQMFCGTEKSVFGVEQAWWTSFPLWLLVALAVAHLSYYLLERPLFRLRSRFRRA